MKKLWKRNMVAGAVLLLVCGAIFLNGRYAQQVEETDKILGQATLVDGKYHPVDSNELSFKMAARLAYKAGIPQANPVILEPVGSLKVYIPDSYMGDIIGDLNKRRGRVMGMNPAEDGLQLVEAEVPMSEVADYAITLRSMTQGRGSFSVKFERYEPVPAEVQEKIIADAKFEDDDE